MENAGERNMCLKEAFLRHLSSRGCQQTTKGGKPKSWRSFLKEAGFGNPPWVPFKGNPGDWCSAQNLGSHGYTADHLNEAGAPLSRL
jgi:hypothetical protein